MWESVQVQYQSLIYRVHARQSMFTRFISDECVEHIIHHGEIIEDYPQAFPFPARLFLGWCGSRPVHVVAAEDSHKQLAIVITVYEPSFAKWEADMRTRRK